MRSRHLQALSSNRLLFVIGVLMSPSWWGSASYAEAAPPTAVPGPRFEVSFPESVRSEPLTGRVFVVITRGNQIEPRLQADHPDSPPLFGVDVHAMKAGESVVIDQRAPGTPASSASQLPPGEYYVQAYALAQVEYRRADGHTIWALDQWNAQDRVESPGNLFSRAVRVSLLGGQSPLIKLPLILKVPPAEQPPDTALVKHIKLQSRILSQFWGRPIYLGAVIILPPDYSHDSARSYPVIYETRNHYLRTLPFDFSEKPIKETSEEERSRSLAGYENGYEFYKNWVGGKLPKMLIAQIISPTPYYDYSSSMNSVNNGPYGDAIIKELIPFIEQNFRIIRSPHARVLVGKSTGGRDSLALQLRYPEFFGGSWVFYSCAFDYSRYYTLNIYKNSNVFVLDPEETADLHGNPDWWNAERLFVRTLDGKPAYTWREWARYEAVVGGRSGVGAEFTGSEDALNGPVASDGYPRPLFNKLTGKIDPDVANYWRQHDLALYLRSNWPKIGSQLNGKLHFYVGDGDEWFRNYQIHDLEAFIRDAQNPHIKATFEYGPLKGHRWQPMTNTELVRQISDHISKNTPMNPTAVQGGEGRGRPLHHAGLLSSVHRHPNNAGNFEPVGPK